MGYNYMLCMYIIGIQNRQENSRESFATLILLGWFSSLQEKDWPTRGPVVHALTTPLKDGDIVDRSTPATSGGGIVASNTACDGGASESDGGYKLIDST
jgi:hypothetical protein